MNKQQLINTLKEKIITQHTFGTVQKEKKFINDFATSICEEIDEKYYGLVGYYTKLLPLTIHVGETQLPYAFWDDKSGNAYISAIVEDGASGYLYSLATIINSMDTKTQVLMTSCNGDDSLASALKKEIDSNPEFLEVIHDLYHTDDIDEIASLYFRDAFTFTIVNDQDTLAAISGFFPKSYKTVSKVLKLIYDQALERSKQEEDLKDLYNYLSTHEEEFIFNK